MIENMIAWLLARFDSDRNKWTAEHVIEIDSNRTRKMFFCPGLSRFVRRGKPLEVATRKDKKLAELKFQKRSLNTSVRREAVTLDMVLHVQRV